MDKIVVPYFGWIEETGHIVRWNQTEGEQILSEETLVEIETDRAIYELQGYKGVVRLIHAFVDESVVSGQVIGLVGSEHESLPDLSLFERLKLRHQKWMYPSNLNELWLFHAPADSIR